RLAHLFDSNDAVSQTSISRPVYSTHAALSNAAQQLIAITKERLLWERTRNMCNRQWCSAMLAESRRWRISCSAILTKLVLCRHKKSLLPLFLGSPSFGGNGPRRGIPLWEPCLGDR